MRSSSKLLLVAALTSTWWACDSPSRPSPPALRELVITGPPQVAPGTTATGNRISLTPSSPTLNSQHAIDGRIYSDVVTLNLWYDEYYGDYGLLDRVSSTDWVGIRGVLQGTARASSIEGSFTGAFDYYLTTANAFSPGHVTSTCAADPAFVLRRE
jgi:hypothetical protein